MTSTASAARLCNRNALAIAATEPFTHYAAIGVLTAFGDTAVRLARAAARVRLRTARAGQITASAVALAGLRALAAQTNQIPTVRIALARLEPVRVAVGAAAFVHVATGRQQPGPALKARHCESNQEPPSAAAELPPERRLTELGFLRFHKPISRLLPCRVLVRHSSSASTVCPK